MFIYNILVRKLFPGLFLLFYIYLFGSWWKLKSLNLFDKNQIFNVKYLQEGINSSEAA